MLNVLYSPNYLQLFDLLKDSPATGPSGLQKGNVITTVNQCPVADTSTWKKCLADTLRNPTPGYCISAEFVRENDESASGEIMEVKF